MRGGAARGADGAARHLRLDPRLDRARRGRPDPPAGRAPVRRCARSPAWTSSARRRQRDGRRLAHHPRAARPPGRAVPDPAERADARPPAGRAGQRRRRGTRRLRAGRGRPAARPRSSSSRTGSEVQLALARASALEAEGTPTRVVSMPCVEWFDEQDAAYRERSCRPAVRARVSVEAGRRAGLARVRRRRRRVRQPRALRRLGRRRDAVRGVRHHRRARSSPPHGQSLAAGAPRRSMTRSTREQGRG